MGEQARDVDDAALTPRYHLLAYRPASPDGAEKVALDHLLDTELAGSHE